MKKHLLLAAIALTSLTAGAQTKLYLSTYQGTDIARYDGKTMPTVVNRYLFNGWNTISLPFSLTEEQVAETFGADCRLEKLVGAENDGNGIRLNFQDCRSEGMKANIPYILKYSGENKTVRIFNEEAYIENGDASVTFTVQQTGERVTFACAKKQVQAEGLYGILVKDNSEATFTNVSGVAPNGFHATRCYVEVSSGTTANLITNHLADGEATSITALNAANAKKNIEVYNVSGHKVANSIEGLLPGIYVINGKKYVVK